jgi:hypothetical protein
MTNSVHDLLHNKIVDLEGLTSPAEQSVEATCELAWLQHTIPIFVKSGKDKVYSLP